MKPPKRFTGVAYLAKVFKPSKLVEELRAERNVNFVAKTLDLLVRSSYLDKVLSMAGNG